MNCKSEYILSDNEISIIYGQLQAKLKLMQECLKHNKSLMKDFGQVTCEYGSKIEAFSKKSIDETMNIKTNKLFKEMGQEIKLLGSKIIGQSQAIKELIIPINDESKTFKLSFNDYVKQIDTRKKDQDEQYKKIEDLKSKISTIQKSTYFVEKSVNSQLKQLKQQEKMMEEEQKMKQQQVLKCKKDLCTFIEEESLMIEHRINHSSNKCYQIIYFSLEYFFSKFNQVVLLKQLAESISTTQNRTQQRSSIENRSSNYTQRFSYNQRSISPVNQKMQQELKQITKNNNKICALKNNDQILNQIQNFKCDNLQNDKQKSKTFSKLQFKDQLIGSQDVYDDIKEKSIQKIKISKNNKENQNLTLSSNANKKQSGINLINLENSNASIFNCKGHGLSSQDSLNEPLKKE
ncbi:unnamed protein product [Paramecium sonneborni]|uniref:Uncharacterized protein n=1 Tax=Paramecium sonneborni TaxID=65129 RepID=A0A8S1M694_9CILI|nr:unnamed protein product [Paramecium sonneborni]